ncbi:MAG: RimK family alpha-L-glutamate ligase [Candidatus Omnitrophota bacterium]|jgi:glutathione synthase/RimK-type ligase-like ATP-grasp enzyme|nr:MAG: RimK family alpha-L-glutamate ligase [Candidatus Omnitrophota bacterium]
MPTLIVVNQPKYWPLYIADVKVVSARSYLTDPQYSDMRNVRVFNLCRSYRYQSIGYYVSLLASARGHKPIPSVENIQDMKSNVIIRLVSDELDELIQKSMKPIQSESFTLSIYFGKNLAKRYDRLSGHLFNLFQVPFLRAEFRYSDEQWRLQTINPISAKEIPEEHYLFVIQVAEEYFASNRFHVPKRFIPRYDMAILYNPQDENPPSNEKALQKFMKAARRLEMGVELIKKEDFGRLPQFDALFIRETTNVNHHTYRFSRRAAAEGLVVVDDPNSIEKCTNKVFLAELMERYHIPGPKTLIVHRDNINQILQRIGLPCIVKKPDSYFSQGVYKAENEADLNEYVEKLLDKSDLIIAQEFLPTPFDWRVGIFDRYPLYVCKYHMAKEHWQIMKHESNGDTEYGHVDTLRVEAAPEAVVKTALKAANAIGDGLYGVDLKQVGRKVFVIEINDNPSIDAGFEDAMLKDELYMKIMTVFLKRIEQRKERKSF